MSKSINYAEKIESLEERRAKLLDQRENIDNTIKDIESKIKDYKKAQTIKDIDKTIVVLEKIGLSMSDVAKAINSGNFGDILSKLTTGSPDAIDSEASKEESNKKADA